MAFSDVDDEEPGNEGHVKDTQWFRAHWRQLGRDVVVDASADVGLMGAEAAAELDEELDEVVRASGRETESPILPVLFDIVNLSGCAGISSQVAVRPRYFLVDGLGR